MFNSRVSYYLKTAIALFLRENAIVEIWLTCVRLNGFCGHDVSNHMSFDFKDYRYAYFTVSSTLYFLHIFLPCFEALNIPPVFFYVLSLWLFSPGVSFLWCMFHFIFFRFFSALYRVVFFHGFYLSVYSFCYWLFICYHYLIFLHCAASFLCWQLSAGQNSAWGRRGDAVNLPTHAHINKQTSTSTQTPKLSNPLAALSFPMAERSRKPADRPPTSINIQVESPVNYLHLPKKNRLIELNECLLGSWYRRIR